MGKVARIRTEAIQFEPVPSGSVSVNNAIFVDSTNANALTSKTSGGSLEEIGAAEASMFKKEMQCASPIRVGKPVSKLRTGKIVEADSDLAGGQNPCGFSLVEFVSADDKGLIFTVGPNLPGLLDEMGFAPGDIIYLDEVNGGMTNNVSRLQIGNDSIISLGMADCSAGDASSTARDLIFLMKVIARPG